MYDFDIVAAFVGAGMAVGVMELIRFVRLQAALRKLKGKVVVAPASARVKGIIHGAANKSTCHSCGRKITDFCELSNGEIHCMDCVHKE